MKPQDIGINVTEEELVEAFRKTLDLLPASEREIIAFRFGWPDGPPHSRKETARRFGISLQRVRRLEEKMLRGVRITLVIEKKARGRRDEPILD
ncbi:sigma factor-like helix-turn-helix DNA-binding protein [Thermoflexus sp.]|uniref:sigma factor-like helix-turn-helix DNA-binding protein n=1 Tax=Thermoflexus sp. TaxID=1969742 RepID=UPI002ADE6A63|nr:sigma factor-like helix-turn-helix DNA-binding protein [Thermoflexus sp.]